MHKWKTGYGTCVTSWSRREAPASRHSPTYHRSCTGCYPELGESDTTGVTAEMAFCELLEEFGEDTIVNSPMTRLYGRFQKTGETGSNFAIALEALPRRVALSMVDMTPPLETTEMPC